MKHIFFAFAIFALISGCATTNLNPVTSQDFTFEEDEKRLWDQSEKEQSAIDKNGYVYRDEELEEYLNQVAKKLISHDVFKNIPFKVRLIKNHHLNAFAMPHGAIYIHTGMLARMDNEAQLAIVLAHEMTHSTHRHALRSIRDLKNKTAFLVTLNASTVGLGAVLGGLAIAASISGYSRELETEADTQGIKLMVDAGYDPAEAPKLFHYIKKELEEENIKEPFFFGNHPRIQERIENYEMLMQNYKKDGIKNTEIFSEKIHKIILINANLDLKAGRFNIAQKGVEKYLLLRPNDAVAYYYLGEVYRQKGEKDDLEKAKMHYQKAISLNPAYPHPHRSIGLTYLKTGDKSLAKKSFEAYLTLAPKPPDKAYVEEYIKQCTEGGR